MDIAGLIPTFGNLAFTIVAFIAALSVIVAIHEYGHYIVGRWSGIKAEVFSIGFGPILWSKMDRHGTRWQIAALPFGGYVKFLGDSSAASGKDGEVMSSLTPEEQRATMHGAPLWARTATVAAGPIFNFILSFLIFATVLMLQGVASDPVMVDEVKTIPGIEQDLREGDVILAIEGVSLPTADAFTALDDQITPAPTLEYTVLREGREMVIEGPWISPPLATSINPGSAAEAADLRVGDYIFAVDGIEIFDFKQLRDAVGDSGGEPLDLTILRDQERIEATLNPVRMDIPINDTEFETRYMIGLGGGIAFTPAVETPGIVEALIHGVDRTGSVILQSLSGLYHMVAGKISTCNLSGPIGIAEVSGQAASLGWLTFLGFIALLSTAVGLLNLFPIPVLDGGHLVFFAWEAVTGRPPSDQALRYLMAGGLTLMLALMVFATGTDLFCP